MKKLEIFWDKKAVSQFLNVIKYIYNDSPKNASHVRNDINELINSLLTNPEKAFKKHHLKISYRFFDTTIRIVRIRHTSQNPKSY